jgi:hypothetical protein
MDDILIRIDKDLMKFKESESKLEGIVLTPKEAMIVNLAKMYASDSKSWMDKRDYYTSFSCISYAHGLMDAVLIIHGKGEF